MLLFNKSALCFPADLRGHAPDVHGAQLPPLLPDRALGEPVQRAPPRPPQGVQLDQARHPLPERGQVLPGKTIKSNPFQRDRLKRFLRAATDFNG